MIIKENQTYTLVCKEYRKITNVSSDTYLDFELRYQEIRFFVLLLEMHYLFQLHNNFLMRSRVLTGLLFCLISF